ncbi:hypothetical protein Harman_22720 [Haloarcula mannanilytica]|uniref:Uncharacterized protein n=1 Tax=Haloarcula mannanilytica TaxID=2509225 RepID=A0A4C2EKW9_9EURY|nr:hypothetical protein [Haloarcula mannanilytica]GCF14337.1 hypothetical protein Harman_22720 [Haloarcula mannanilytica]
MEFESTRRRFMQLAGTSATVSLAGCNALLGGDGDGSNAGTGPQNQQTADADAATVTVAIEPDQAQLQQRQQEIQSEFEAGNLTQGEAQSEYRTAQKNLAEDAINAFTERATSDLGLTVDDSVSLAGALLVTGPPAGLIDSLSVESVTGLFPQATFEQIRSRVRTGTPTASE